VEPDLVILDIQMREIDGAEILKSMKSTSHGSRAKYLAIVCHSESLLDLKEIGCDDFLSKPFNSAELEEKVKSLLGIYDGRESARR
jgi:DNA-binding response OmpR family regulator